MPKPTTAKTYPHFATYRDDAEWMGKAKKLAADRGVTLAGLMRQLIREEWTRLDRRHAQRTARKEPQS